MNQERTPTQFGLYLLRAMANAGYSNPSRFARAAGRDPSVVHRWIYGITVPTAKALAEVAPTLGVPEADLIAAAFSSDPDDTVPRDHVPQVAAELAQMLRPDSPLSDEDRQFLGVMTERLVAPYRSLMRKRRSA